MKTLKYGIKHIEGGDRAKDLPAAMEQSAQSIVSALDSFNYNGKDPNLVLSRVAALEAAIAALEPADSRPELLGTLRRANPDGTGAWQALNDAAHASIGIKSVSKGADFLRIHHDFTAAKVLTFTATLDESLSKSSAKIAVGASVGLAYTDLYFYFHNGTGTPPAQDPNLITTPNGNIWLHGVFEGTP